MPTPKFVEVADVLAIHQDQINRFGGVAGIRDEGLLESALAQPQASFFGELLHPTAYEQAAAYLYHLARNHPFFDGNKRTAFAVMVTFLRLNGYNLSLSDDDKYTLVMQIAQGQMTKEELAVYLKKHVV